LQNWSKIEFIFSHKLHINPIILRELEYYTIYNILKEYEDYIDKENKEYEKQQREAEKQYGGFKSPKDIKPPKLNIPKINTPKI